MPTDIDSIVDNCYLHLDKGHGFYVAAVDKKDQTVELQYFNGDLEEISLSDTS